MMNDLINKTVEICVGFAAHNFEGGSSPDNYKGTLLSIGDDFWKLKLLKSKSEKDIIYIASKYIIYVKEI